MATAFGVPLEITDRDEPVIGFRVWKMGSDLSLRSVAMRYAWMPGKNVAECFSGHCGNTSGDLSAPHEYGNCGLYVQAYTDQARQVLVSYNEAHPVIGAVMGWGIVLQHDIHGWRAEYAQPIALLIPDFGRGEARAIAKKYGIPIFDTIKGLEVYAEEYGKSLPGQKKAK